MLDIGHPYEGYEHVINTMAKSSVSAVIIIREYGSTPYVGMTRFFSFSPYIGIAAKSRNRPKIDKTRLCIAKYTIYIL